MVTITPEDSERMRHLTPQTVCHNRRMALGFIRSGRYDAEQNDSDQRAADIYAEGMRESWADSMTPPDARRWFSVTLHLCQYCADIPGAPLAMGYGVDGYDDYGRRLKK